ncbi:5'-methylthioadenosine/S-adenosylhomocysteine nucleosidase [Fusobacterium necrophorum]|uniref:MTA/SAH nucleosidase n=2 Tax=Fusobacterium TaxID=848 RepID=A0A017H7M9_9FUSO|nr:5'-methylthioadenosine/S-adenosylhomocysteine nucleosidase [Fusobacterium necrophorum]EHO19365.1 MTA/SAH nucleosidase [Fusobacterium necrophorum subsp. funduliforme 1_1_36S]AVQ21614.1 5'-methylthioadenosine nucleosidase [Fusobacterium necrophorum subsp. funduliforme]EYD70148.1 purine or other phosphorylase family 1 [Fusobacterium necrophorum subsp. funduliforme B35]KID49382.1 MTA/SAH nucleosidase [Fusobacterium necrophorum subsp. funduliforme B35]MBR8722129.1 5'-methylthioadenosine/S-adenos
MKKIVVSLFLLYSFLCFAKETILVQGAMDMEIEHLVNALEGKTKEQFGSWTFWKGNIGKNTVIVSRTEIGLTNASAATTLGIEKYSPTIIINQGTSGGHDPKLHSGDIVLAKATVNIGAVRTERKEYGIPENPRDGIFFEDVQCLRNQKEEIIKHMKFYSDETLLKLAKNIKYTKGNLILGVVASADQWNRELERIQFLHHKYGSSTEEMETVAVAQVSKAFGIPFLGVRILSNSEIHQESFNPKTALWCQEYVLELIKNIP